MSALRSKFTKSFGAWSGIALALGLCAPLQAGSRIFHCVGPQGELVFRDQPCSRAGLLKSGERKAPAVLRSNSEISEHSECGFQSDPLALGDPLLKDIKLRLQVEIDDDGPYLSIVATGHHSAAVVPDAPLPGMEAVADVEAALTNEEPPASTAEASAELPQGAALPPHLQAATFDFRVSSQGIQFADGRFIETEWRMGAQTLGFGRSRMRSLLTALSQEPASVLVWFEGFAAPVSAPTMPAEDFRLAVDNARRCWKTRTQAPPTSPQG